MARVGCDDKNVYVDGLKIGSAEVGKSTTDKLEERIHALEILVHEIQEVLVFYNFVDLKEDLEQSVGDIQDTLGRNE